MRNFSVVLANCSEAKAPLRKHCSRSIRRTDRSKILVNDNPFKELKFEISELAKPIRPKTLFLILKLIESNVTVVGSGRVSVLMRRSVADPRKWKYV